MPKISEIEEDMSEKFLIEWNQEIPVEVAVGDTLEFPPDTAAYAVLGINEDGIVVKRLENTND